MKYNEVLAIYESAFDHLASAEEQLPLGDMRLEHVHQYLNHEFYSEAGEVFQPL